MQWSVKTPQYGRTCKVHSSVSFLYLGIPNAILTVPNLAFLGHSLFHLWKTSKITREAGVLSDEQVNMDLWVTFSSSSIFSLSTTEKRWSCFLAAQGGASRCSWSWADCFLLTWYFISRDSTRKVNTGSFQWRLCAGWELPWHAPGYLFAMRKSRANLLRSFLVELDDYYFALNNEIKLR